jgi:type IV secretory pathway VirB2 component (pilin)
MPLPYARAHFWIVGLLALLTVAFWPSYFAAFDRLPIALHIHGATSSLWLLLAVLQSWWIHHARTAYHRKFGIASLVIFPFFLAGLFLVIYNNAVGIAVSPDAARLALGPRFSAVSVVVIVTACYLYYSALKSRRRVHLHAGYMLAIPILLVEPVTSRLFNQYLPGFRFGGPADMGNVINASRAYYLSITLVVMLAIRLYALGVERRRPFLILALMFLVQAAAYWWPGATPWWTSVVTSMSAYSLGTIVACGVTLGVIVTGLGWWQGRPDRQRLVVQAG